MTKLLRVKKNKKFDFEIEDIIVPQITKQFNEAK